MLTARDSLDDKLRGFEVGADDYLTKPFALEEVYVRCQALARRDQLHRASTLEIGELRIDTRRFQVMRQGETVPLTKTDFAILQMLAEAFPNAVSKRHIAERLWGDDLPDTDTVRSHIYTLRTALDKPFSYPMIKTVHGIGFRLEAGNEPAQ
jgi:DNA-binding response OmpR family regulator